MNLLSPAFLQLFRYGLVDAYATDKNITSHEVFRGWPIEENTRPDVDGSRGEGPHRIFASCAELFLA